MNIQCCEEALEELNALERYIISDETRRKEFDKAGPWTGIEFVFTKATNQLKHRQERLEKYKDFDIDFE